MRDFYLYSLQVTLTKIMDADRVRELERKILVESTKFLMGMEEPARLFVRSFFMLLPYTDKIGLNGSNVKAMGQAHVLLEGGTGVGKTDLVECGSNAITAIVNRIQGTPDLMPYHILGDYVFVEDISGKRSIRLRPGKLYSNILFIDEANRIKPHTKSAIFEGMEERSVTPQSEYLDLGGEELRGKKFPLFPISGRIDDFTSHRHFQVFATQNVFGEEEGTSRSPRAELDRFTMCISMNRPPFEDEAKISSKRIVGIKVEKVTDLAELLEASQYVYDNVSFSEDSPAWNYKVALIRNTDPTKVQGSPAFARYIKDHVFHNERDGGIGGGSPRVQYHLEAAARVQAFFSGSDVVRPEHVKAIAPYVINHRLVIRSEKEMKVKPYDVFGEVLENTRIPGWKISLVS